MNRLKLWVFAATLIGGLSVFTACSSGSDDVQEPVVNPDPDDNGANSSITARTPAATTSAIPHSTSPAPLWDS